MAQNCFNFLWFITIIMCNASYLLFQKYHICHLECFLVPTIMLAFQYKLYIQRVLSFFLFIHTYVNWHQPLFYLLSVT